MTTAADVVNDALLAAGVGDQYNALDAATSQLALRAFNRMIDSWSNDSLVIYNRSEDNFAMTAGQAAYSTSLLTTRPIELTHVFVRQSNVDYQCDLIGAEDYARIAYKPTTGLPDQCYYNSGFPTGVLTFFPTPGTAYQAYVGYLAPLADLATLQTALSLPPGYERALVFGLACEIAPYLGVQVTPSTIYLARSAKHKLKSANYELNEAHVSLPIGEGLFNIYRGQ